MHAVEDVPARLTLRAHSPVPALLRAVVIPRRERTTRAVGHLLGFWALIPLVALLPPHLPWALAALLLGLYFFRRSWAGAYVVDHFQASCPRCGGALHLPAGARIGLPHPISCPHCHFEPVLEGGVPGR